MSFIRRIFFSAECPNCHKELHKSANFCRHCGWGNSLSWRRCQKIHCGVSVAADSKHCWKCGSDLLAQPRSQIFSDRWMREPRQFAIRIPLESPAARLQNGIQVDHDTRGIFFLNGQPVEPALGAGYHPTTTFLKRLFATAPSTALEAVIVSGEPTDVFVRCISPCRTQDHHEITVEVTLIIMLADLVRFAARYMPTGIQTISDAELSKHLAGPVQDAFRPIIAAMTGDQLKALADRESYFAAQIKATEGIDLKTTGLGYCGIRQLTLLGDVFTQTTYDPFATKPLNRPQRPAPAPKATSMEQRMNAAAGALKMLASEPDPKSKLEDLGQHYGGAVGLVVLTRGKERKPLATAWLAEGVKGLITNAHVATQIAAELDPRGPGSDWDGCSVIFEGGAEWKVSDWTVHPEYPAEVDHGHAVIPNDLALLHAVPVGAAATEVRSGIPLASPGQARKLQRFTALASLGFPLEVGIGVPVNPHRPVAAAHRGSVVRITDWTLGSGVVDQTRLITHSLPSAKGVSGSPVFDETGHVVGVICAGNMHSIIPPEELAALMEGITSTISPGLVPSASMLNYAIRIDVLRRWLEAAA